MASKAKTTRRRRSKKWLVFVDTNILLDLYRLPGESAKRTLATLEEQRASLVMTDQVWMEFLKNRQRVISQTIKDIAKPTHNMPSVLRELPAGRKHLKHQRVGLQVHKKLITTIEKLLRNPTQTDPVYQCLSRIFASNTSYNLKRPNKKRYEVRDLAQKRFSLGYPPRKDDTLRLGDAINWEWIVACAQTSKCNVVIVSRDGDFGLAYGQECILNDWLRVEFKERVGRNRKIELTNKLSTALRKLHIALTPGYEEEETKLISESDIADRDRGVTVQQFLSQILQNRWEAGEPPERTGPLEVSEDQ
jgi:predicted nucleic acid-binding protein